MNIGLGAVMEVKCDKIPRMEWNAKLSERLRDKNEFVRSMSFVPAAVGVSTEQHLSAATAHGAVRLVAIVIVHVGDL